MPEQSEHHQQDEVDDQQRIIEKGEKDEIDRQNCSGRVQCRN